MPTDVSVVIATRSRPEMLRRAVRSVADQDHPGAIEIIVVFDHTDIDPLDDVELPSGRALRTVPNDRRPGLAGARNCGISHAANAYIAFCDDDDEWKPEKLKLQQPLLEDPETIIAATGIEIHSPGGTHERTSPSRTTLADLLRSRITELHPSSFLLRTADLRGRLGGIDEDLPASYGEDYDLLLRAAKTGNIAAIPDGLTIVHWDRASYFSEKWQGIVDGLTYLLDKHPELLTTGEGAARIEGQIAFAYGALGERGNARRWAWRAIRHDPRQPRAVLALAVGLRLLSPQWVVRTLNQRGRGM